LLHVTFHSSHVLAFKSLDFLSDFLADVEFRDDIDCQNLGLIDIVLLEHLLEGSEDDLGHLTSRLVLRQTFEHHSVGSHIQLRIAPFVELLVLE
jgi:hypothetical protein